MTGQRVFQDEIGDWPKIYALGPGHYEVVARHTSPGRLRLAQGLALLLSVAFCWYIMPPMTRDNWGFVLFGYMFGGFMGFILLGLILSDLPFFMKITTRVTFRDGAIRWGRHVVPAGMRRSFRAERHRAANAEARSMQRSEDRTRRPIFQTSSEIIIDSGPNLMHARLVAQIARDESLEWGHLLGSALRFVDEQTAREGQAAARQQMRVRLD